MKTYLFYQENTFGKPLRLILSAENDIEALKVVKKHISKRYDSLKRVYEEKFEEIKENVNKRFIEIETALFSNEVKEEYLNRKDFEIGKKTYSVKELIGNEKLFKKYAKQRKKETYMWFFKHERFQLKDLTREKPMIIESF